jgi:hypothetical protein
VLGSSFDIRERAESCLPDAEEAIHQCLEDDNIEAIGNLNHRAEALVDANPPVDYLFMKAFAGPLNMCESERVASFFFGVALAAC